MTNVAEAIFCTMAFYYFINLKYNNLNQKTKNVYIYCEKNMMMMTFAITIAFLIRSSSLVGWIPLALAAIFS